MKEKLSRRRFLRYCGRCAVFCAGMGMAGPAGRFVDVPSSEAQTIALGRLGRKLSPYFTPLDGKTIRCELCPRRCEVEDGERGYCRVRENTDGNYYSLVYGNPCSIHIDPIEKKPFFHVLPSTRSFSLATAGCNFDCKFCQNWEISQARPDNTYNYDLSPEEAVRQAVLAGCRSIASTYVEPTIFMEYMLDIGALARKQKLLKVMHSNGYVNPGPLRDLCGNLDAACIDLKGFTPEYYRDIADGTLQPVLDTLKLLKECQVHTEIVTLIVPGKNDDMETIRAMCRWIKQTLGPGTPLHFTRFSPLYKLKSVPPTPVETLEKARNTAMEEGLRFVYIGNAPGHAGERTICPKCNAVLIERTGFHSQIRQLKDGSCASCGLPIPGIWKLPEA